MPVGGAFLGGVSERTPAGKTTLILQAVTEDNKNLSTAKWTISATGRTYNVTADADGRAEQLVDSGFTYTITPTITGNYDGLTPQTVKADSTEAVLCQFDLRIPRALDSAVVHKTGTETISGNKTFSDNPEIRNVATALTLTNTYLTIGLEAFSSLNHIYFNGNDGRIASIDTYRSTPHGFPASYLINEVRNKTGDKAQIEIRCYDNGTKFAMAPTPADDKDNSSKIATTEWVNKAKTIVHTTGNEEIGGEKTFKNTASFVGMTCEPGIKNSYFTQTIKSTTNRNVDATQKPKLFSYIRTGAVVPNGVNDYVGAISVVRARDNSYRHTINVQAIDDTGSTKASASLEVVAKLDGSKFVLSPPTPTNADGTEIVTAGWSNAKYVSKAGDETITGKKTFGRDIRVSAPYPVVGTETATRYVSWISLGGSDNKTYGYIRSVKDKTGVSKFEIDSYSPAGVESNARFSLRDTGKEAYATCPTPSDKADNSNKIATTGWIHDTTQVVHTFGNEDILGKKSIKDTLIFPAADTTFYPITMRRGGTGGNRFYIYGDINNTLLTMYSTAKENYITVGSGNTKAYANTTPDGATSNEIVTADYLNGKLNGKQDAGNYQPAGNYATREELTNGLNGKQPKGDYAPNSRITVSTSGPSGGVDGDVWFKV